MSETWWSELNKQAELDLRVKMLSMCRHADFVTCSRKAGDALFAHFFVVPELAGSELRPIRCRERTIVLWLQEPTEKLRKLEAAMRVPLALEFLLDPKAEPQVRYIP